MTPFLKSVAEAFCSKYKDMTDFCFVFPSKRSGSFFCNYLNKAVGSRVAIAPKMCTIIDFVSELCEREIDNRIDLIFLLYKEYVRLTGEDVEFDKFRSWGDIVLSDFNDVDMSCVSAEALFANVKDYKEIQSNYLTDDQQAIINGYFGEREPMLAVQTFWRHFNSGTYSESKSRFMRIWESLSSLYGRLNETLEKRDLTYTGGAYRMALKRIMDEGKSAIPYKKVIFVGFNVLSAIELRIFSELKKLKCDFEDNSFADFYWDCTGPALKDPENSAYKFIAKNIEMFPSMFDISSSDVSGFAPNIRIVSCPSNTIQAKKVGELIGEAVSQNQSQNDINVAVILPDESLLLPLLHSFPKDVTTANLTMGYPFRLTSTASFVALLRKCYDRARLVAGDVAFYFEDVKSLLAHPFAVMLLGHDCIKKIRKTAADKHLYNISSVEMAHISKGRSAVMMRSLTKDATACETIEFLDTLLESVQNVMQESDDMILVKKSIEDECVTAYREALGRIREAMEEHGVEMKRNTLLSMADRLLAGESITFNGEPLRGVQIMGVLESRCLDFTHLIIPSMNERIFPRRMRSRSFIPNTLRQGYGMPTIQFQESIFSYYFYRMISRAQSVTMLYDARVSGMKSGDQSRYITQLQYLYPQSNLKFENVSFKTEPIERHTIEVKKSDKVLSLLAQYTDSDSNKYLSASSLKNYISCPLKFYFRNVEGIDSDREPSEFMDAISIGNVFHHVMQDIYTPEDKHDKNKNEVGFELSPGKPISAEYIKNYLSDEPKLKMMIGRRISAEYNRSENERVESGDVEIFAEIILEYVKKTLEYDYHLTPFIYKGSEVKNIYRWEVSEDVTVNMKYIIDRLDIVSIQDSISGSKFDVLRIVDYKTGSDNTELRHPKDILNEKSGHNSAIFQLLLYSHLYSLQYNYTQAIKPCIYKTRDLVSGEDAGSVFIGKDKDKTELIDYRQILVEDEEGLTPIDRIKDKVTEIFDAEISFTQTTNQDNCKYCEFKQICQR